MSLLPYLLDDSYGSRPSRLLDQHFGLVLGSDDFLRPQTIPRLLLRCPAGYLRNWTSTASERDTGSAVTYDKNKFQANLDVQQFQPEEISVKVTGENTIIVEGKHEEKPDEHGHIYRHFVRKYVVPKNFDLDRVESKLSSDGVLTIAAPKVDEKQIEHKEVPINQTGQPAKAVEQKSGGDKK